MTDLLRFSLLGLGTGGIYALLGLGLVVIYRGSGVINFAQSGFALVGAYVVYRLHMQDGHGLFLSVVVAVVACAALGVLVHFLVMRPLRSASPLARVIATLGVLTVLSQAVVLEFGGKTVISKSPVPTEAVTLPGDIVVGRYAFWLLAIAVLMALLLTVTSARTRFGYAISAAAENPRAASALGWSPDVLASVTWAVGGALRRGGRSPAAGDHRGLHLADHLQHPDHRRAGHRSAGRVQVLPGGAARRRLHRRRAVAGHALEQRPARGTAPPGHRRRRAVPGHHPGARGPGPRAAAARQHHRPAAPGRHRPGPAARGPGARGAGRGLAVHLVGVLHRRRLHQHPAVRRHDHQRHVRDRRPLGRRPDRLHRPAVARAVRAGRHRRVHRRQADGRARLGVRAGPAGRGARRDGDRLPVRPAGAAHPRGQPRGGHLRPRVRGLPAGLQQHSYTENARVQPTDISFFGMADGPGRPPAQLRAVLCLGFLVLAALAVANLRRGRIGRRLLAVRTNERAAAAIGVNVFEAKLYAFTLSAGIAGLGGVLLGFSNSADPLPVASSSPARRSACWC